MHSFDIKINLSYNNDLVDVCTSLFYAAGVKPSILKDYSRKIHVETDLIVLKHKERTLCCEVKVDIKTIDCLIRQSYLCR